MQKEIPKGTQGDRETGTRAHTSLFPYFPISPVIHKLALLAVFVIVAACGPSPEAAIPTRPPAPTFTPTVAVAPPTVDPNTVATAQAAAQQQTTQAQPAPQQTSAEPQVAANTQVTQTGTQTNTQAAPGSLAEPATATSAPPAVAPTNTQPPAVTKPQVVVSSQVNIRQGPGTNYAIVGAANPGQRFDVTGKTAAGDWWQVNFNGQAGWVFGQLVTPENVQAVAIAQNIPAPPPPTNTSVPAPTQPPAAPQPTQPPAAPPPAQPPAQGNFRFQLLNTETCAPNEGQTYMNGFVRYKSNAPRNAVCVHLFFYEPRTTKCSGCDGVGDGVWGFSPFNGPAPAGTTVEVFVIQCPSTMPLGGQNENFGDLTPLSPKWVHTFNKSEQCTGITFVGDE